MAEQSPESFVSGVRATLRRYGMVAPGDRVVVGVSGGPDSLALLHALHVLRDDLGIALHVAHLNHRLRRAAAEEARFVAAIAERLGVPCTVASTDVRQVARERGISLEHAGRRERYRFFGQVALQVGARRVATAHTADDNVETVLLNLLRGVGSDGLAGIPPVRPLCRQPAPLGPGAAASEPCIGLVVVRPLFDTWREAVEAYCLALGLEPRRDPSNRRRAYLRNRVRWDLLPYLERRFGGDVKQKLHRLAALLRPECELLDGLAAEALGQVTSPIEGGVQVRVSEASKLPLALQRRVLRAVLRALGVGPERVGFREIERLTEALGLTKDTRFDLPGPVRVARRGDALLLTRPPNERKEPPPPEVLPVPGCAPAPGGGFITAALLDRLHPFEVPRLRRAREAYADADAVALPLVVRPWRPGDHIAPPGTEGHRSLHKLFQSAGIPAEKRHEVPVVEDARGIVWVGGVALAERVKVTLETRRLLHLRWEDVR